MRKYKEVEGDLIDLALNSEFDLITHGCNCMCNMGAGIAPKMAKAFACNEFLLESAGFKGNINKLGQIDTGYSYIGKDRSVVAYSNTITKERFQQTHHLLRVVNSYTQFNYGANHADGTKSPLDYEALTLCLRKINLMASGLKVGLPMIGCGLAGGNWGRVKTIIMRELKDCDVTVVIFKKKDFAEY